MSNLATIQNGLPAFSMGDIEKMANYITKSGLFGVKQPAQAVALMLIAQAEGKHPAIAAKEYHIIQGKSSLTAEAMLARFQQAGGKVEWKELTDKKAVGVFSHAQGGSIEIDWSIDMAKKAGLVKGGSGWEKYPRAMLRSRCVSEGVRTVYPAVILGTYTPEEVENFDTEPAQYAQYEVVNEPTPTKPEIDVYAMIAEAVKGSDYFKAPTHLKNALVKYSEYFDTGDFNGASEKSIRKVISGFAKSYVENHGMYKAYELAKDVLVSGMAGQTDLWDEVRAENGVNGWPPNPEMARKVVESTLELMKADEDPRISDSDLDKQAFADLLQIVDELNKKA